MFGICIATCRRGLYSIGETWEIDGWQSLYPWGRARRSIKAAISMSGQVNVKVQQERISEDRQGAEDTRIDLR